MKVCKRGKGLHKMNNFDLEKLNRRLESVGNPEKVEWSRKIIQTKMPMLAVMSPQIKGIVKSIGADEVISYLECEDFKHYENTIVYAKMLSKVKNFDDFVRYLNKLIVVMDNWATVDLIEWKVNARNCSQMLELAKQLITDSRPFARRTGVRILFKLLDDKHINEVLKIVATLKFENEYYVNMCVAWLLCDCFIKQREKALAFLNSENVNDFVMTKTVSKCCDSFRVSLEDKKLLKSFLNKN